MKGVITYEPNGYGFGYDWTLNVTTQKGTKSFFLGQDVKFCRRILGIEPREIVNQIGDNDLRKEETRERLGEFILNSLDVTEDMIENFEPWSLFCQ